jgi:hypothetical protein
VDSQASLVFRKNKNKRQMAGDSNPFIYGGGIPMIHLFMEGEFP